MKDIERYSLFFFLLYSVMVETNSIGLLSSMLILGKMMVIDPTRVQTEIWSLQDDPANQQCGENT